MPKRSWLFQRVEKPKVSLDQELKLCTAHTETEVCERSQDLVVDSLEVQNWIIWQLLNFVWFGTKSESSKTSSSFYIYIVNVKQHFAQSGFGHHSLFSCAKLHSRLCAIFCCPPPFILYSPQLTLHPPWQPLVYLGFNVLRYALSSFT